MLDTQTHTYTFIYKQLYICINRHTSICSYRHMMTHTYIIVMSFYFALNEIKIVLITHIG